MAAEGVNDLKGHPIVSTVDISKSDYQSAGHITYTLRLSRNRMPKVPQMR